jgi:hypothetical protein
VRDFTEGRHLHGSIKYSRNISHLSLSGNKCFIQDNNVYNTGWF